MQFLQRLVSSTIPSKISDKPGTRTKSSRSINVSKNRSCNTCDESKARSLGADRIEILSDLVEVE